MLEHTNNVCSRTLFFFDTFLFIFVSMMKKYTIRDIADLAGVSKGTVDRVLHNRGKVSEDALIKVNKVLGEIDYKPNPIAKSLKNSKIFRVCILFPQSSKDRFWAPCVEAIKEVQDNFQAFGIKIDEYRYNSKAQNSFLSTANELIETQPDAILIAPLFHHEAQIISKKCIDKNIPISTFNNIIDKESLTNYIGQDLYQTGRVAAKLLDSLLNKGHLLVVHIDEKVQNATHMQEKENGFNNYFENNPSYKISSLSINKDPKINYNERLEKYLNENKEINGVFVTTSKTHVVAKSNLDQNRNLKIVGYDLIQANISHLESGSIDFLINQNPKKQAFLGLTQLAEFLLFEKEIPKEVLLPIDIVNSENFLQYLE